MSGVSGVGADRGGGGGVNAPRQHEVPSGVDINSHSSTSTTHASSYKGHTPLHDAAGRGDLRRVADILASQPGSAHVTGASEGARNVTALHVAASRGRVKVINLLIDSNASVHSVCIGEQGGSPLHLAARGGHVAAVRALIAASANVESASGPRSVTPLHEAAKQGHVAVMFYLCLAGARLDCRDGWGEAALFAALRARQIRAAAHILASVDFNEAGSGDDGGNVGVSPLSSDDVGSRVGVEVLPCRQLTLADVTNVTPSQDGLRGLRAWREPTGAHMDRAKTLVKDIALLPDAVYSEEGRSPMHWAAAAGRADVVPTLVACGVGVNDWCETNQWITPLHVAASAGHVSTMVALIAHGAEVSANDIRGRSPLHYAAQSGCVNAICALLTYGAELKNDDAAPLRFGDDIRFILYRLHAAPPPIVLAIEHGHVEAASLLRNASLLWTPRVHPDLHRRARDWVHHLMLVAERMATMADSVFWLPIELWLVIVRLVRVRDMLAEPLTEETVAAM